MASRNPKYTLVIKSKCNDRSMTIAGVAFENDFGGLSLKLNPGVVLKWDDEVFFNLNPYMTKRDWAKFRSKHQSYEEEPDADPPGGDEHEDSEESEDIDLSELPADDDEPK